MGAPHDLLWLYRTDTVTKTGQPVDYPGERVLSKIDSTSLIGKKVSIVGAFTRVNPGLISVVPVSFEVQQ